MDKALTLNKKSISIWNVLAAVMVAVIVLSCAQREESAQGTSETTTIEPAAAQPSPTGTDAMTQTVTIGDDRSPNEGAGITEPESTGTVTATTGTTTTSAGTATTTRP